MLSEKPLAGLRVIDLTRVLAGPFCTMNLADLGAEVIKIELPGRGDDSRGFAPMTPEGHSGYFYSVNRGKRSVTVNLRKPEGAALILDLCKHADLVVESFKPGTMASFGLDFDKLREANPKIILCSISGFGQTGPRATEPSYDIVAQALGGTMSVTGEAGGAPMRCGVSIGDLAGGLYGVIAILAALRRRDRDGVGCHLDIAMLDCQVAMLEGAVARYSMSGEIPGSIGTRHPSITPFQRFHAADGYFVLGVGNEPIWARLCEAIGMPELREDPRFIRNPDRTAHHDELERILEERFATRPRAEWLDKLRAASVPCAPINNIAEVTRDEHLRSRSMIVAVDEPTLPGLIVPGSPIKTAGSKAIPNTKAPALGADTEDVLETLLGCSKERMSELRARSII
jgi:CoA:oxalate CoA-transferase